MRRFTFKRVLATISVVCLCAITTVIIAKYIKYNREYESFGDTYSSECYSMQAKDGYKIINSQTGKTTLDKIDWLLAADQHPDTLVVFSKMHRRGYFNRYTGEITIPEQYTHAWIFAEGLAAVVSNDKVGFINRQGKVVIDFQYPYFKDNGKSINFVFHKGYCSMFDDSGKCGIINQKGEWILKPSFDYIEAPMYGKRIFKENRKYGVLGDSLQVVIPAEYAGIELTADAVVVTRADESKSLLSYKGEMINPYAYSSIARLDYDTGKYMDSGIEISEPTGLYCYGMVNSYGLMSEDGKPITPPLYKDITSINKNLFQCILKGSYSAIIIDRKGNVVKE